MCRTGQGPSVRDGKPGTGKLGTVYYYLGNRGQKTGDSILFLPLGPGFVDPGFGGWGAAARPQLEPAGGLRRHRKIVYCPVRREAGEALRMKEPGG